MYKNISLFPKQLSMKKRFLQLNKGSKVPSLNLNALCSNNQTNENENELKQKDVSSWLFFDFDSRTIDETAPTEAIDHVSELLGIQNGTIVSCSKHVSPVWQKRKRAITFSNPSERYTTERNQDVDQNGFLIPMIYKPEVNLNLDDIEVNDEWTDFT